MNNQTEFNASLSTINTFLWVAALSGLVLFMPAMVMHLTDQVNWRTGDLIVMGGLLFSSGSMGLVLWPKIKSTQRLATKTGLVLLFLYIWAELAVGIFTDMNL